MRFEFKKNIDTYLCSPNLETIEAARNLHQLDSTTVEQFRDGNISFAGMGSELVNNDAEYTLIPVRALSKEIVAPNTYRATDFRVADVLKVSRPLLANKGIYADHRLNIDNNKGVAVNPTFAESFTTANGVFVPAGINVFLKLHNVREAVTIAKMTSNPPELQSVSVGIEFEARRSHDLGELDDWEYSFYYVGQTIDGRMVTWEATNIIGYDEISIVYDGASETSNVLDNNGVPFGMETVQQGLFGKNGKGQFREQFRKKFFVLGNGVQKINLSKKAMNEEKVTILGFELAKDCANAIQAEFDKNKLSSQQLTQQLAEAKASLSKANTEKEQLTKELGESKSIIEAYANTEKERLENIRAKALEAYARTGQDNEGYRSLINSADEQQLTAVLAQLNATIQNEFGSLAFCENCNTSDRIVFKKSKEQSKETNVDNNIEDVREMLNRENAIK